MRGDCMLGRHVLNRYAQDDGLVQHRTTGEQSTAGFLPNLGAQASCATLTTVRIDHNSRSFLYSYHPTRGYTASQLRSGPCPPTRFSRRAGQPWGLPPQTHNPQAPGATHGARPARASVTATRPPATQRKPCLPHRPNSDDAHGRHHTLESRGDTTQQRSPHRGRPRKARPTSSNRAPQLRHRHRHHTRRSKDACRPDKRKSQGQTLGHARSTGCVGWLRRPAVSALTTSCNRR